MEARILYLDDSGKPDAKHASRALVIAGFAIDAKHYPTFSRRVLGAKAKHYPNRGQPQAWEIKSTEIVKPNPWKRSKNREFAYEVARLLETMGCTAYSVMIDKTRMHHQMALSTTMPLQLQALVEHFDAECRTLGRVGMVVADWSTHQFDQHASQCVASFAASRNLAIHPGVYYASSQSNEGIQAADLIAATCRRVVEGDAQLVDLQSRFTAARPNMAVRRTVRSRHWTNQIRLF